MSHKANFWLASLAPGRVKSGAFRVLFHLCDHHNAEADPNTACYPSQETLRQKTGLSNGALNNALAEMEADGILVRRRSTVPGSSERRTYYILGCDLEQSAIQTPESGVCANSTAPETAQEQTPVSEGANSSLGPSKLQPTGEEPGRTGKNQGDPPLVPPSEDSKPEAEPPPKKPPRRSASLPPDWIPSDRNLSDARDRNFTEVEIHEQSQAFRDYHLARGTTFKDWDAAWRTWLGNARRFGRSAAPSASRPSSAHDGLFAGFQRAAARRSG